MDKSSFIGSWVRRFLLDYLVMDRDLSPNTQQSYRDTLRLILPLLARVTRKSLDKLEIEDMSAAHVKTFLQQVEEDRGCGAATRNQRLAAIRSLASFIATHSPEHISWYGQIRAIPFKRSPRPELTYLEKSEIDALLQTPDRRTAQGRRDHAILLFLYNSGARASEVATVQIGDLDLHHKERGSVLIHGKGTAAPRNASYVVHHITDTRTPSRTDHASPWRSPISPRRNRSPRVFRRVCLRNRPKNLTCDQGWVRCRLPSKCSLRFGG